MCLFILEGHDEVNITIEIKPDDTPEVAEVFTVNLVNVSDLDRIQTGAVSISAHMQHMLERKVYQARLEEPISPGYCVLHNVKSCQLHFSPLGLEKKL